MCNIFFISKTWIGLPYVAKQKRQLNWKKCSPMVTPQTASGVTMVLEGSFLWLFYVGF